MNKKKKDERLQKDDKARRQNEELKRVREEAAKKAREIRDKHKPEQTREIRNVFKVSLADISKIDTLTDKPEADAKDTWANPFIVTSHESIDVLFSVAHVIKELTTWGGDYQNPKKLGAAAGRSQETGRAQREVKAGYEECEKFMSHWAPAELADLSNIAGGKAFAANIWMIGFHPGMGYAGFTPNQASMLRLMNLGNIRLLLIEPMSLLAVLADEDKKPAELKGKNANNTEEIFDILLDCTTEILVKLCQSGVKMAAGDQTKGTLLYVPQGWIVVEWCPLTQSPLNYGFRRSFMLRSEAGKALYEKIMLFCKLSGKNISTMEEIFSAMGGDVAPSGPN